MIAGTGLDAAAGPVRPNKDSTIYKMCLKKKGYYSEIQAAAEAGRQSFKNKVQLRWYKCYYCKQWHLTHLLNQ